MTLRAQAGQALREKRAARERQDSPGVEGPQPPRIFAYFLFVKKVWPAAASGKVKTRAIPHRKVGAILAEEI